MNKSIIYITIVTAILLISTANLKSNIIITSPLPADTIYVGDIQQISWDYPAGFPINLYFAQGTSNDWNLIAENVSGSSYSWPVPPVDSSQLRFKAISSGIIEPIVIWDATPLTPHTDLINSTSFSDDGNYILTAGKDGFVKIWDISSKSLIDEYDFSVFGQAYDAKFYRSINTIIINSGWQTYLWDRINNDIELLAAFQNIANRISVHPTEPFIATCSFDGTANIIDINSKATLKTFTSPDNVRIQTISFSPDGNYIVYGTSGSTAGYLYFVEWETNNPATVIGRHGNDNSPNVIFSTSFSPDGLNIVSTGFNGSVRIWDIALQTETFLFTGHKERVPVMAATYRPGGNNILSGSLEGSARQWNPLTGIERHGALNHGGGIMSVAYSPTGDSLLTAGRDNSFKLWRNYYFVDDSDSLTAEVRYRAEIQIPDIVSKVGNNVGIPIILIYNYDFQSILSDAEITITVELPNNLLDLKSFGGIINRGRYKDTITLSLPTGLQSPDTLDVLRAIVLYGNIKKDDINILSYEITENAINNLLSIETDDGSIEIEYECGNNGRTSLGFSNTSVNINIQPNPAESYIDITLNLIEDGFYQADILSMAGEKVFPIFNENMKHGIRNASLDINFLPSGVYYYRLTSPAKVMTKKFIIRR